MTRIGPAAARRTIKAVADGCRCAERRRRADDARRTRRAMCAACNGNRPRCPRTQAKIDFHVNGLLCPRGWHPDARGRVRWARLSWSGVPFPLRLYLYLRKRDADPETWVDSFSGCGCIRSLNAAWKRLTRPRKHRWESL